MPSHNKQKSAEIIGKLSANEEMKSLIAELQNQLKNTSEQFVWKILDAYVDEDNLKTEFKSAWIFVLRKDTPSQAHYYPNSTQYTAMIEGEATCEIGGEKISLVKFDPSRPDTIYVIDKAVPHEFFPAKRDLVVLSLHTVNAEELIEINCSGSKERKYT